MKNMIQFLAIISALFFAGIQSTNAQISFHVKLEKCDDECTTQEDCYYGVYYTIVDECGAIPATICNGYVQEACDVTDLILDVTCDDCSLATHNPCFRVDLVAVKLCVGPGGSHIICQGSKREYHSCAELTSGLLTIDVLWD